MTRGRITKDQGEGRIETTDEGEKRRKEKASVCLALGRRGAGEKHEEAKMVLHENGATPSMPAIACQLSATATCICYECLGLGYLSGCHPLLCPAWCPLKPP
jgi:hypothetical protein